MNPYLFHAIIFALTNSGDWPQEKFTSFCDDIAPLLHKREISYRELCPIYDKYIHRLDKLDMVLKEIEK